MGSHVTPIKDMATGQMRELRTTDLAGGGGGGGGGGDASAANQTTQIARLDTLVAQTDTLEGLAQQTRDRLPSALGPQAATGSMSVTQDADSTWRTRAFQPTTGTGGALALTAATTSAAQAVTAGSVLRLGNSGSTAISIEFGTSGVVATANSAIEIMPGTSEAIMVPSGATHFAGYCAQASTLRWIVGTGS